jgi:hypothetical protein
MNPCNTRDYKNRKDLGLTITRARKNRLRKKRDWFWALGLLSILLTGIVFYLCYLTFSTNGY